MPGILPMKVIKVGTSSLSRIAQACDRCRSKKIRCDGIRPCCTQCANVGFECRTSDKLSRRAFPRGYTESLEERVRVLEAEVRDLKDLLDEKDEKIDMLSKMHGNNGQVRRSLSSESALGPEVTGMASPRGSPATVGPRMASKEATPPPPKEDVFRVQASPLLLGVENSDSYYMGPSSGRGFIDAFKRKLQEAGKPCADFTTEAFLHIQGCCPLTNHKDSSAANNSMTIPPRLFSDRCVNIYFQEWAPLFPVLHRPTFLRIYEDWVTEPDKVKSNHKVAQLYLVFGIAALSSEKPDLEQVSACEMQWRRALSAVLLDDTMETLQCLVLALAYCQIRADNRRLQHYKCLAVGLSHRLGLHQSQKRFSFGALTIETRKKIFWTLYTLDCFSAATLGLPKLVKEEDIHTEYPNDVDDEYVTEKGFLPTLPGESTRLSSALALFRASRILAKVLEKNYPAATSYDLSLQQMGLLEAELDGWYSGLPQHLRLTFKQDKPSTDITGSRSPLLAIAYYFTRTLIYRPAVGSSLGPKAAPAVLSTSDSSKHMIQIVQLLKERNMSFSFCLNKTDLLVLCGMTLLYQALELRQDSKMRQDNGRLVNGVLKIVGDMKAPGMYDLKRVAKLVVRVDEVDDDDNGEEEKEEEQRSPATHQLLATPPGQSPKTVSMTAQPLPSAAAHKAPPTNPKKKASNQAKTYWVNRHASMSETDILQQQEKLRRMTMPNIPSTAARQQVTEFTSHCPTSRTSLDGGQQHRREQRLSMAQAYLGGASDPQQPPRQSSSPLSFFPVLKQDNSLSTAEWEALIGQIDGNGVYDSIYGGPQPQPLSLDSTTAASTAATDSITAGADCSWSPVALDLSAFTLGGDFGASEESLSSVSSSGAAGDDLGGLEYGDFGELGGIHDESGHHGGGFGMDGMLSVVGDGFGVLL